MTLHSNPTITMELTEREASLIRTMRQYPPGHPDHFPESIDPRSLTAKNLYQCQAYFLYGRFEYMARIAQHLKTAE